MGEPIKLRGHHIGVLALYYDQLHEDREAYDRMSESLANVYGRPIQILFEQILISIQENPKLEIEIVNGLDTLCQSDCPRKSESCGTEKLYDEDGHTLRTYQLNPGEVYSSREILERIIDFKSRFKVGSPRQVQVAAIAFETPSY